MRHLLPIIAGLLVAAGACAAEAAGRPAPVSAAELDSAIDDVIAQPEYAWRLPRRESPAPTGFWSAFWDNMGAWAWRPVQGVLKWARKTLKKIMEWLKDILFWEPSSTSGSGGDWQTSVRALVFVALAATLSFLVILLLRVWRARAGREKKVFALARPTASDILEERVAADDLPMDEWMTMAREFLDKGQFRLAVRAMFLGCLVSLANREKLTIARHKSNREYIRELNRRAHDAPDMLAAFSENVGILEKLWYGMHMATEEVVMAFTDNQERILGAGQRAAVPPPEPQV
ncbi:hypothetical protein ACFLQU_05190 [Verrucomicrobiota bacterium]